MNSAKADETARPSDRVREAAAERGLAVEFRSRPRAGSLHEAAAALGIEPSQIVKTLVVQRSDGSVLFVLVPGERRISWPKLRAIVGANRLKMADPAVAHAKTGYERGTIVPLGSTTDWPVYADERIVGQSIAMGAGGHDHQLFMEADDLIAAFDATVADITEPEAAG